MIIILVLLLIYDRLTRKYDDAFTKSVLIMGQKGTGKSMLMCKMIHKYLKMGCYCYTTENIVLSPKYERFKDHLRYFSIKDFGKFNFPPNSVIFIDEIMSLFNNRNYQSFPPEVTLYLTLNRKAVNRIVMFTQNFSSVDKVIRVLSEKVYLIHKYGRIFTIGRQIDKEQYLKDIENCKDSDSQLVERMSYRPFYVRGAFIGCYIPAWIKCTRSYDIDKYYSKEMPYYYSYFDIKPSEDTGIIERGASLTSKPMKKA